MKLRPILRKKWYDLFVGHIGEGYPKLGFPSSMLEATKSLLLTCGTKKILMLFIVSS